MTKTCSRCRTEKQIEQFYRERASRDGRARWCSVCSDANTKQQRKKKPEQYRAYDAARRPR